MPHTGKRPKKMPIMTVGLPTGKKDKGKKKVISPSVVVSSGDEALDWGSDDGRLYDTWMMTLQSLQVLNSSVL